MEKTSPLLDYLCTSSFWMHMDFCEHLWRYGLKPGWTCVGQFVRLLNILLFCVHVRAYAFFRTCAWMYDHAGISQTHQEPGPVYYCLSVRELHLEMLCPDSFLAITPLNHLFRETIFSVSNRWLFWTVRTEGRSVRPFRIVVCVVISISHRW